MVLDAAYTFIYQGVEHRLKYVDKWMKIPAVRQNQGEGQENENSQEQVEWVEIRKRYLVLERKIDTPWWLRIFGFPSYEKVAYIALDDTSEEDVRAITGDNYTRVLSYSQLGINVPAPAPLDYNRFYGIWDTGTALAATAVALPSLTMMTPLGTAYIPALGAGLASSVVFGPFGLVAAIFMGGLLIGDVVRKYATKKYAEPWLQQYAGAIANAVYQRL